MTRVTVLVLLAMCTPLFADTVLTTEKKSFDGVITSFNHDGSLILATGYGDLTFAVTADVSDVLLGDYAWPKSAKGKKPLRASTVQPWIDARAAKKLPWAAIPDKKEAGEVDAATVVANLMKFKQPDANATAKDLKAAKDAINKDGQWTYVAFKVSGVGLGRDADVNIGLFGEFYDPRTGQSLSNFGFRQGLSLDAAEKKSSTDVDEANESILKKAEEDKESFRQGRWIDHKHAENLKIGDGVIFRVTVSIDTNGDESWVLQPVRLKPKVKLQ